jgi:dihydrolipoamide dehydrogenase
MSEQAQHDVLVIGAGPGGYVGAIRCAQLGLSTAIVEREPALGGTCLRVGCIPSKALLESSHLFEHAHHFAEHGIKVDDPKLDLAAMLKRKDGVVKQLTDGVALLMKKNKIKVYAGVGAFNDDGSVTVTPTDAPGKGEPTTVRAKHVVIATGSRPAALPGIDFAQPNVDTSTDAIAYDKVPAKLVVIGAGYIGIELGSVWRRLGART